MCLFAVCVHVCSSQCCEIADKFHLTVYFGNAHSQSQAVILQVLSVGGGVVGERGVGDELMVTYCFSMCVLSNTNKVII